jgi:NH3-dependent NAD+ synthetase
LELNEGDMSRLQEGNIKARVRMIYLRHLASIHRGVVLDNDNFTEWNLGFWTVGGDSPMDINLGLHYLWKTEIYELAGFLYYEYNIKEGVEQSKAILESIKLTPTDGNGVSSSDCEQFGLDNYSQVDDVLKTMYYSDDLTINCDMHPEYIRLIDSYNEQGVDKVMVLHQNTAYKRKELPIKPTKEELGL